MRHPPKLIPPSHSTIQGRGLYDLAIQAYSRGMSQKAAPPSICKALAEVYVSINDLPKAVETFAMIADCDYALFHDKIHALEQACELSMSLRAISDVKKFEEKMQNLRKKYEDKMQKEYDT